MNNKSDQNPKSSNKKNQPEDLGGIFHQRTPERSLTPKAWALQYARMGLAVLPMHTVKNDACSCSKGAKCTNPGKHPRNVNGVKGASTEPAQIREWWSAFPKANIGIACGTISNILAIDID
jgi:hypothetical protein